MNQRTNLRAVDGGAATPDESTLLLDFRAMDEGTRRDVLAMMRAIAQASPRHRPELTLVQDRSA